MDTYKGSSLNRKPNRFDRASTSTGVKPPNGVASFRTELIFNTKLGADGSIMSACLAKVSSMSIALNPKMR
jgi:hypothetical protein